MPLGLEVINMFNYNEKQKEKQEYLESIDNFSTLLTIEGYGDLSELWEYNLPTPHEYERQDYAYKISWYVDGVFWTMRGIEFANDILSRFAITFRTDFQTIKTISKKENTTKLKYFQNLRSIKKSLFNPNTYKYDDSVFWGLKLWVEYQIKEGANFISYDSLESYAFSHYIDIAKDRSTLRAKCRNIWYWYDSKDWKSTLRQKSTKSKEEILMTRKENMTKVAKERGEATRRLILNALSGLYASEYKKKNGDWNIAKIAKELKVSRNSVYKYIQEFEQTN